MGAMRQKNLGANFVNLSDEEGDMCSVSSGFKGKFGGFSGELGGWYICKRLLGLRHFKVSYLLR